MNKKYPLLVISILLVFVFAFTACVPQATVEPTSVPATAVPPTAVPPTAVPPTEGPDRGSYSSPCACNH